MSGALCLPGGTPLDVVRGWTEREAGGGSFPTGSSLGEAEGLLTSPAGLDEEQLGLPAQAGAAGPVEDVHDSLHGHRRPIGAIHSPRELEVAGLEDPEPWSQHRKPGRTPTAGAGR